MEFHEALKYMQEGRKCRYQGLVYFITDDLGLVYNPNQPIPACSDVQEYLEPSWELVPEIEGRWRWVFEDQDGNLKVSINHWPTAEALLQCVDVIKVVQRIHATKIEVEL